MPTVTGFQSNTTIHAAFWIFKPDPSLDPTGREQFVEVNGIQYAEAKQAMVLGSITNVILTSNILTLNIANSSVKPQTMVIFSGLTNATFLNGQIGRVISVSPTQVVISFIAVDYPSAVEPAGAQMIDAGSAMIELYYASTNVSTSQAPRRLDGVVAAKFIYDMEALFV